MKKNLTFPLGKDVPVMTRIFFLIGPMFFMLAISFPSFAKNNLSPMILGEAGAIEDFGLIMMLSTLAASIFAPVLQRIGDAIGRKKLALYTMIPYAATLVLIGFAKGTAAMAVGYALLGLCASTTNSCSNGMVMDVFDPEVRTKYLSYMNAANALASMFGPKLVGILSDNIGAQKAMMSLTILLGIAWVIIIAIQPNVKAAGELKIDGLGALLLPFAIGPFCVVITCGGKQIPWSSPIIWILLIVSVVFAVIFYKAEVKVEKEGKLPMVTMSLLKDKRILMAGLFMAFMNVTSGIAQFLNLYCQSILNFNGSDLGTLQIFVFIPAVTVPFVGIWLAKTNKFKLCFIVSGLFSLLAGVSFYFFVAPGATPMGVAAAKIPMYLQNVLTLAPLNAYFAAILPARERGLGLAVIAFFGSVGQSIFTSAFSMILNMFQGNIAAAFPVMAIVTGALAILRIIFVVIGIKDPEKETAAAQA